MSETKKKTTSAKKSPVSEIDYDKLATAMVKANKEYESEKNAEIQQQKEKELEEWRNLVGYKKDKPLSLISAFFKMLVMDPKDIKGDRATSTLLSFVASSIMLLGMIFMFLLMTVSILAIILAGKYIENNVFHTRVLFGIIAFFAFVFGNLFRISVHEIQNVQDKDYLNTILSSILTIVGTIFALVELFRG